MSKLVSAAVLVAVAISFFLIFPSKAEPVGLGITDFNSSLSLTVGENKAIEVARLYNTGSLDLNITSSWIPNYNSSNPTVKITPNPLYLASNKSASIYLNVTGTELGRYDGYVDFSCDVKLLENHTGNPTLPGGRVNAVFNIVERPAAPILPIIATAIIVVIIGVIGIIIGSHWRQKRLPAIAHRSTYARHVPCAKSPDRRMEE